MALAFPLPNSWFQEQFLADNLAALGLRDRTRALITDAAPQGSFRLKPSGTPYLQYRERPVGVAGPGSAEALLRTDPPDLVVVFGLGTGQLARELREMTDAPIIVIDPEPGLVRTLLEAGPVDLGGIAVVCTIDDFAAELTAAVPGMRPLIQFVADPTYRELYSDLHDWYREQVTTLVERCDITANTFLARGEEWLRNLFANLPELAVRTPAMALEQQWKGTTAFIVGAGPSLDGNIELLREAKRKGILIAVNTAARALARRGIEPHIVISIESVDITAMLAELPFLDRCLRIHSVSSSPRVVQASKGPCLLSYEGQAEIAVPLRKLYGYAGLSASGSVSTAATSLAIRMGCNQLVLVGQDLSYRGDRVYATGTLFEESRLSQQSDGKVSMQWCEAKRDTISRQTNPIPNTLEERQLPAWGGEGTVLSSPMFLGAIGWFESAGRALAQQLHGPRPINATEGGAHLEGWEDLTLAAVLKDLPYLDVTVEDLYNSAITACPPIGTARLHSWVMAHMDGCTRLHRTARRLRRYSHLVARDPERYLRRNSFTERLDQAETQFRDAVRELPFANLWASREIEVWRNTPAERSNDLSMQASSALRKEASLARIFEDSALIVRTQLEEVLLALGEAPEQSPRKDQVHGRHHTDECLVTANPEESCPDPKRAQEELQPAL